MSANKAALLGNTTERKIIEHDRALKGLKVRQYVSADSLQLYGYPSGGGLLAAVTLAPGETYYGAVGLLGEDGAWGIPMLFWNFYVDVDLDLDYQWFNGAQVLNTDRKNLLYGWKHSTTDFNGSTSGKTGKMQIDFWVKNDGASSHTYYIEGIILASYKVTAWGA